MVTSTPSADPANFGHLAGVFKEIIRQLLLVTDDMLPATIISYDRATNLAQVQPMIMMVTADGSPVGRAPVASIPVLQIGAGNFMLNYPMNPGDTGWIKANDRDISLFMQSFTQIKPNTFRMHTFEDAIFIPSVLKGYTINSEDADNVVLSTLDGTQRIAIWSDRVKITSTTQIILDAPDTNITGRITAQGIIHSASDVTARTVSLHGHVHINGGGIGDSGPPAT